MQVTKLPTTIIPLETPAQRQQRAKKLARPYTSVTYQDEIRDSSIDADVARYEREKKEIETLKHQLATREIFNVNKFLINKYSDGNFSQGIWNGYDNSLKRKVAGLSFEYHVYFPKVPAESRPKSEYFVIGPLLDHVDGDSYYYHFPVHNSSDLSDPQNVVTDTFDQEITPSGTLVSGETITLPYALQHLQEALEQRENVIPTTLFQVLQENGFIDQDSKILLAVRNKIVEKYLASINVEKQKDALQYLAHYQENLARKVDPAVEEAAVEEAAVEEPAVEEAAVEEAVEEDQTKEDQTKVTQLAFENGSPVDIIDTDQLRFTEMIQQDCKYWIYNEPSTNENADVAPSRLIYEYRANAGLDPTTHLTPGRIMIEYRGTAPNILQEMKDLENGVKTSYRNYNAWLTKKGLLVVAAGKKSVKIADLTQNLIVLYQGAE